MPRLPRVTPDTADDRQRDLLDLTAQELRATRDGHDQDPHTDAILRTASAVIAHRGAIPDADLDAARADGVTDPELAEIVAHVALNALSNHFNHLAQPELDFPAVDDSEAAA